VCEQFRPEINSPSLHEDVQLAQPLMSIVDSLDPEHCVDPVIMYCPTEHLVHPEQPGLIDVGTSFRSQPVVYCFEAQT
jgi:hypothetical protein